jgi:hypothetical protein
VNGKNKKKLRPALAKGKRQIGEFMEDHGIPGYQKYIAASNLMENLVEDARKSFVKNHGSVAGGCQALKRSTGISPGSSWGRATVQQQQVWEAMDCDENLTGGGGGGGHSAPVALGPAPELKAKYGGDESKMCLAWKAEFGVQPGRTWGTLPLEKHQFWRDHRCDNLAA